MAWLFLVGGTTRWKCCLLPGDRAIGGQPERGEQQRSEQVYQSEYHCRRQTVLLHEQHDLGGERRERRQSAEETGDREEPPLWRDRRVRRKVRDGNADQIAADQIRGQRAERKLRQPRIEPVREPPAQPRARRRAHRDHRQRAEHQRRGPNWPSTLATRITFFDDDAARPAQSGCSVTCSIAKRSESTLRQAFSTAGQCTGSSISTCADSATRDADMCQTCRSCTLMTCGTAASAWPMSGYDKCGGTPS